MAGPTLPPQPWRHNRRWNPIGPPPHHAHSASTPVEQTVAELKISYKLDEIPCCPFEHSAVDPRLSALLADEAHLVGIDGPRDDLASWMLEDESSLAKHRKVLSIVGFGGLGKTTLAREVYRKIQGHFHCQAFVSVSQKPNVKKIMKDLISQLPCKEDFAKGIDTWDEAKCIVKIKELLQDKRYLIVIDDIWSISAWNAIKYAFPENDFSSRIVATTRIVDVARSCCLDGNGRMYEIEALSDLHSKILFFKRIFGLEDRCPDVLKQISNKILKKCGGLPLAIITISSLLATKPVVKDEWERVRRSICSALDKGRSLDGMNSILSLSYNDLSPNLKSCLLYLSIYPEDYVIVRDILVRRWIAEAFISEERGQSKQEVAENHFYELINKSMVQPVEIGYDGKACACQVHDMMLELIISKSVEDNFISLAGHSQTDLVLTCHISTVYMQAISGFNIIKSPLRAVEELGKLNRLKELHLLLDGGGSQEYKRHEEMLFSSLCKLVTCKLQSLWIYSPDSTPIQFLDSWSPLPYSLQTFWMTSSYYLPKMPKWIVPALTSLSYLNINLIEATEEDLRLLGEMPALLCLNITFNTFQKERLTVQGIAFPCLKELYLICWESAIYLTFEEGALLKLEKLVVPFFVSAAEAYGFYLGLGHLPCLRDAIFTLCNYVGTSSVSYSAAATAIRNEANCHPNRPKLSIRDRVGRKLH
ncbi:disease resistance protein RGA5-like [Aegilops tauschii subsp. strangulata]|uniref:Disease resistance protein RPM1 n=1 Tax=Aegilops tauschii TaxID=37682 RepID=M8AR81_AEGTA